MTQPESKSTRRARAYARKLHKQTERARKEYEAKFERELAELQERYGLKPKVNKK